MSIEPLTPNGPIPGESREDVLAICRRFFKSGNAEDDRLYCSLSCMPEDEHGVIQLSDDLWKDAGNVSVCVEPYPVCAKCGERLASVFRLGNTDGPWFSEEHLHQLAKDFEGWAPYNIGVRDARLFYDAFQDYHCLKFAYGGHNFVVQSYKILCLLVDDEKHGQWRCSRYQMDELVGHVRDKYGAKSDGA